MSDKKKSLLSGAKYIFGSNPILVLGLIIGPVVVCAVSFQNALALALAFATTAIPVITIAGAVGKFIPASVKLPFYVGIAAAMLVPTEILISRISPVIFDSIGIFLPIMAVNSVVTVLTVEESETRGVGGAFFDSLFLSLGFAIVTLALGAIRELLGSGTIMNMPILGRRAMGVLMPGAGFVILGFMAAGIEGIKILLQKRKAKKEDII